MRTIHTLHLETVPHPRPSPRTIRKGLIGWAFVVWVAAFVAVMALAAKVQAGTVPAAPASTTEQVGPPVDAPSAPATTASVVEKSTPLFPPNFTPKGAGSAASRPSASGTAPATSEGLMAMALPLALVVGVIFVVAAVFQRVLRAGGHLTSGVRAPSGIMEMLGRYPVGRGQNLLLIKLDQRVLLIGQTLPGRSNAGSLSTLTELTDGEDVASILLKISESESAGPASKFNKLLNQHEGEAAPARGARALAQRLFGNSGAVVWDETLLKQEASTSRTPGDVQERLSRLKAVARSGAPAAGGGVA